MKIILKRNLRPWVVFISLIVGCEDFLDTQPYGTTTLEKVSTQTKGAESLLIAAYSNLDGFSMNNNPWAGAASNWVFGSIAGGDAYKGATPSDQAAITSVEVHDGMASDNVYLEGKWATYYHGIARANDAITAFQSIENIDENFRNMRIGEARFLRGLYHFEMLKIFGHVPFIDETIEDPRVGNTTDILPKVQEDFLFAAAHLPIVQSEHPGRITKGAAWSYFAITKLWGPDIKYSVAKIYFDSVIHSGRYQLNPTYQENFNAEARNAPESILEVQQSVNDGGFGANGNVGDELNFPHGSGPVGCCGFHQPSQNLVNAFKTDASGLPLFDTYNLIDVKNDEGYNSSDSFSIYSGTLDPRIDWTVGRRGIPYYDWRIHPGQDWIREQGYGGPYSPKKNVHYESQNQAYAQSGWANDNANNLKLLRYADLLLYAAEVEVELGNLDVAQQLVDQVRSRAANPAGWVHTYIDPENPFKGFTNTPAANYLISPYPDGQFVAKGKEYAREAVRFERRLELGMEGHRFFDLVRWGIAAEEKNKYFETEKTKRSYLAAGKFVKGKNEFCPIPKRAIELSYRNGEPTLSQNKGY